MEELASLDIIKLFEGEDNLEAFHRYLKKYGIEYKLLFIITEK